MLKLILNQLINTHFGFAFSRLPEHKLNSNQSFINKALTWMNWTEHLRFAHLVVEWISCNYLRNKMLSKVLGL